MKVLSPAAEFALYRENPHRWVRECGAPGLKAAIERDRANGDEASAKRRWARASAEMREAVNALVRKEKESA